MKKLRVIFKASVSFFRPSKKNRPTYPFKKIAFLYKAVLLRKTVFLRKTILSVKVRISSSVSKSLRFLSTPPPKVFRSSCILFKKFQVKKGNHFNRATCRSISLISDNRRKHEIDVQCIGATKLNAFPDVRGRFKEACIKFGQYGLLG